MHWCQTSVTLDDSRRSIGDWFDARSVSLSPGEHMPCSVPASEAAISPGWPDEHTRFDEDLFGRLLQEQLIVSAVYPRYHMLTSSA